MASATKSISGSRATMRMDAASISKSRFGSPPRGSFLASLVTSSPLFTMDTVHLELLDFCDQNDAALGDEPGSGGDWTCRRARHSWPVRRRVAKATSVALILTAAA